MRDATTFSHYSERVNTEARPRRRGHVLHSAVSDTCVLLDPDSGLYFELDEVGARVWDLADGSRTIADIVSSLEEEYDAPPDQISGDVVELLSELRERGLVEAA